MAKGKKTSEARKRRGQNYKNEGRHAKNKIRRLRKYVAKFPKDLQAAEALKRLEKKVEYTRNHPTTGKGINNNERILRPLEAAARRGAKNKAQFGKNWDESSIPPGYQNILRDFLKELLDQKIRTKKNRSLYG